ncbi:MAG TPA: DoxX family protein [Acidimicrobiales bacterium]|nr:DoxX family protein [Acidimicrobiales bacterium]
MHPPDAAAAILRVMVGITLFAHGWNHFFGGGKIAGTARWFESIGIRPGKVHAWIASTTEIGAGVLLVLGLFTPLAAAGGVGTMTVALVANHLRNGFFIFRKGEGYEYVLNLAMVSVAIGILGGGWLSLDHAVGIDWNGWAGFATAAGAGGGGAALLLATCWRPNRQA